MSEFRDLSELALNRKGQSWGNLGYWKTEANYSEACRALAMLLGEQTGLNRQSVVLDAGFGCGHDKAPRIKIFQAMACETLFRQPSCL